MCVWLAILVRFRFIVQYKASLRQEAISVNARTVRASSERITTCELSKLASARPERPASGSPHNELTSARPFDNNDKISRVTDI